MSDVSNNDETNIDVMDQPSADAVSQNTAVPQNAAVSPSSDELIKENAALTTRLEAAEKRMAEMENTVSSLLETKKVMAVAEAQDIKPTATAVKDNSVELSAMRSKIWGNDMPLSVRFKV